MPYSRGYFPVILVANKWIVAFKKEMMTTGPYFGSGNALLCNLEADCVNTCNVHVGVQDSIDGITWNTRYIYPDPLIPGGQMNLTLCAARHWPNHGRIILFSLAWGIVHVGRTPNEPFANPGEVIGGFFPPDYDTPDPNIQGETHSQPLPELEPLPQCSLTIMQDQKLSDAGEIITPGYGTFLYDCGTEVPIIAVPSKFYWFCQWGGDIDTITDFLSGNTTIVVDGNYVIWPTWSWGIWFPGL